MNKIKIGMIWKILFNPFNIFINCLLNIHFTLPFYFTYITINKFDSHIKNNIAIFDFI